MSPPKVRKKGRFPRTTFPVYCTNAEWRRIQGLARDLGITASAFCVRRALDRHGHALALSEAEQRRLLEAIEVLLHAAREVLEPLPGNEVTLREAVAFLYLALPESDRQPRGGEDEGA